MTQSHNEPVAVKPATELEQVQIELIAAVRSVLGRLAAIDVKPPPELSIMLGQYQRAMKDGLPIDFKQASSILQVLVDIDRASSLALRAELRLAGHSGERSRSSSLNNLKEAAVALYTAIFLATAYARALGRSSR
jgi:hypothetical protein